MNVLLLDPGKPLPEELNLRIKQLTDYVRQGVVATEESADFDKAIHGARTSMKKLRALLRLLQPALAPESFREKDRRIRDFARQIGGVRDALVMRRTFIQLKQDASVYLKVAALAPLEKALDHNYAEAQETQHATRQAGTLTPQFKRLEESLLGIAPPDYGEATLVEAVRQVYRAGYRGLRRCRQDTLNSELIHQWRKDVKYLWYQMQMLPAPDNKQVKRLCKKLDRLSDTLGLEHDLDVLSEFLHGRDLLRDETHAALFDGLLAARQRVLVDEALREGKAVFKAKPRQFADWLLQVLKER
jgi:CHAD domain-containing protein